jgi:hypothetical protein
MGNIKGRNVLPDAYGQSRRLISASLAVAPAPIFGIAATEAVEKVGEGCSRLDFRGLVTIPCL